MRRKTPFYTETMARNISTIRKEKTQNRTNTGSRIDTKHLDRKIHGKTRRFHMGHRPQSIVSDDTSRIQTDPDKLAVKDLIRLFLNTSSQNETQITTWRILLDETDRKQNT